MRFVDLFCGIGGFHAALHRLGHKCVFATDIDKFAAETYEANWGKPGGFDVHCNIRDALENIPPMDIICAGFPCQPFSKSGAQEGFQDQTRGTLFHDICFLAEKHKPKVLFLENVPNLVKHDGGNTFLVIEKRLEELGYDFEWSILSPHKFGIPQIRTRVYIVAIRKDLSKGRNFTFPSEKEAQEIDINAVIDQKVDQKYHMNEKELLWLDVWEDFLKNVNLKSKLPGHPIWADSFVGKETLPGDLHQYTKKELIAIGKEWSSYGWVKPIKTSMRKAEIIKAIGLPAWKQDFIRKNRHLYANNKDFIDTWLEKWNVLGFTEEGERTLPVSRTKYEWQAGPVSRTNWENLIQFRPSGIRVKRPNYFPALVAIAQIPMVGWLKRHLTPKECARLQNFDVDGKYGEKFILCEKDSQAYKQLGNAVNVQIVYYIQERVDLFLSGSKDFPRKSRQLKLV